SDDYWQARRLKKGQRRREDLSRPRGVFLFGQSAAACRDVKEIGKMADDRFHVYDTTLRDGAQQEGLHLTVADKLAIARYLDRLGVGFIDGGWAGAIPKDTELLRRALTELDLKHARLAAFGPTRRPGMK